VYYVFYAATQGEFVTKSSSVTNFNSVSGSTGVTVPSYLNGYNITYQTYKLSSSDQQELWFLLFCFLWTTEFILALGYIIISIAVAGWYFSTPDDRNIEGSRLLCRSLYQTIRYHMGTAAFGSLVIAIMEFIRMIILYIEKQLVKGGCNNCVSINFTLSLDIYIYTPFYDNCIHYTFIYFFNVVG